MKWLVGAWSSLPVWGKVVLLVLIFLLIGYALYLGLDMRWVVELLTGQ